MADRKWVGEVPKLTLAFVAALANGKLYVPPNIPPMNEILADNSATAPNTRKSLVAEESSDGRDGHNR